MTIERAAAQLALLIDDKPWFAVCEVSPARSLIIVRFKSPIPGPRPEEHTPLIWKGWPVILAREGATVEPSRMGGF